HERRLARLVVELEDGVLRAVCGPQHGQGVGALSDEEETTCCGEPGWELRTLGQGHAPSLVEVLRQWRPAGVGVVTSGAGAREPDGRAAHRGQHRTQRLSDGGPRGGSPRGLLLEKAHDEPGQRLRHLWVELGWRRDLPVAWLVEDGRVVFA